MSGTKVGRGRADSKTRSTKGLAAFRREVGSSRLLFSFMRFAVLALAQKHWTGTDGFNATAAAIARTLCTQQPAVPVRPSKLRVRETR